MYSKPFFRYKITFTIEGQLACSTSEELFKAKIEAANKWWKKFKVDEGSMEDTYADVDSSCSPSNRTSKTEIEVTPPASPSSIELVSLSSKEVSVDDLMESSQDSVKEISQVKRTYSLLMDKNMASPVKKKRKGLFGRVAEKSSNKSSKSTGSKHKATDESTSSQSQDSSSLSGNLRRSKRHKVNIEEEMEKCSSSSRRSESSSKSGFSFPSSKSKKKPVNEEHEEEEEEYEPTVDDLLALPTHEGDDGRSMDEILDEVDREIAEQREKHRKELESIEKNIKKQEKSKQERKARYKENSLLMERLWKELTQESLKEMFQKNLDYLKDIERGKIESTRHKAFFDNPSSRQGLMHTMITHPFSEQHFDWTFALMTEVWMSTKQLYAENNEYVWKVLLSECFIKFYMDFFAISKKEAEQKIKETPHDDDLSSSEDGPL